MATPFLDALTPEQLAVVKTKSRGTSRPSYFSRRLFASQSQQNKALTGDSVGSNQISEDLEAFLILLDGSTKQQMVTYLQQLLTLGISSDDLDLMTEMVAARKKNYLQVNQDSAGPVKQFESASNNIKEFASKMVVQATQLGKPDPVFGTSGGDLGVFSTLSVLYASLNVGHSEIGLADVLAVHDRISDTGVFNDYKIDVQDRNLEIGSWIAIFSTYLDNVVVSGLPPQAANTPSQSQNFSPPTGKHVTLGPPIWTKSRVSQAFRPPTSPRGSHNGTDWAAPVGTELHAMSDGKVIQIGGPEGDSGNFVVVLASDNATRWSFSHMVSPSAAGIGANVIEGQVIGLLGLTGKTTGPHVHVTVSVDHKTIDAESITDVTRRGRGGTR